MCRTHYRSCRRTSERRFTPTQNTQVKQNRQVQKGWQKSPLFRFGRARSHNDKRCKGASELQ